MVGTGIFVWGSPYGVAFTPDGPFAYVTSEYSGSVSAVSTASHTVVAQITVGSAPRKVTITPDGQYTYVVANGSNRVSVGPLVPGPTTPTSGTTPYGHAHSGQLTTADAIGPVTDATPSPGVTVDSSGAVRSPATNQAGTDTALGTATDATGEFGTWSFTLDVTPIPCGDLGYWLVATDGGVFAFGDAAFYGSTGGTSLDRPIVGAPSTSDGRGHWQTASDGDVCSYGRSNFFGPLGGLRLNQPVVGMAGTVRTAT